MRNEKEGDPVQIAWQIRALVKVKSAIADMQLNEGIKVNGTLEFVEALDESLELHIARLVDYYDC
jgi:hypothetical protein